MSVAIAVVGPFGFAALAWGSLALVVCVFVYECYAIARERRA